MPGPVQPSRRVDASGESTRPRGRARRDAVAVLTDRVFVHARPSDASDLVALVGVDHGGLVLTGANPVRAARRCREEQAFGGPILFDLAAAEGKIATRERPFDESGDRLVEATLEERVQG